MFSPICYVFLFLKNRFEINKVLSLFFPKPQECEQTRLLANVEPNFTWTMDWHPILFNLFCQYRFICFFSSKKNCLFFQYVLIVCFPFSLFFCCIYVDTGAYFHNWTVGSVTQPPLSWPTLIWKVLRVGLKWNRICRIWSRGEKGTQLLQTTTTRENKATLKVNVNYCKILPPWEKMQLI